MKKFGEGQQPFHAIIDIPEGDSQELTTVTDQALNSLYGELFNLLQTHGINPTATTNADLKQVARAVWAAVAAGNLFIDTGTANVKQLTHAKGKDFLFRNGNSGDNGFIIEFLNKFENTGAVTVNVFDVENNQNHFNAVRLLNQLGEELTPKSLPANSMVKAYYDYATNAFNVINIYNASITDNMVLNAENIALRNVAIQTVESVAELNGLAKVQGRTVYVKSYHAGLNKGGGIFVFNETLANTNNLCTVINGWERKHRGVINASDIGCKEGDFDNTELLNNLINLASINNFEILLDGLFKISKLEKGITTTRFGDEPMWWLLKAKSNVTIRGRTQADGILVAGGLVASNASEANTKGYCVFGDGNLPDIKNFHLENFKIDNNGANNLLQPINNHGSQSLCPNIWFQRGENITVHKVLFFENAGHQTIVFDRFTKNISITECSFVDNGAGLAGNIYITDHSTIFCRAEGYTIRDNNFIVSGNRQPTINTALELHGANANVYANKTIGYPFAIVRGAYDRQISKGVKIHGNYFENCVKVCEYDCEENTTLIIDITDNIAMLRPKKPESNRPNVAFGHTNYNLTQVTPTSNNYIEININRNKVIQLGEKSDWTTYDHSDNYIFVGGKFDRATLEDNEFENFSSCYSITHFNSKASFFSKNRLRRCGYIFGVERGALNSVMRYQNIDAAWQGGQVAFVQCCDELIKCGFEAIIANANDKLPAISKYYIAADSWLIPSIGYGSDTAQIAEFDYKTGGVGVQEIGSTSQKVCGKITLPNGDYFFKKLGINKKWNLSREMQITAPPTTARYFGDVNGDKITSLMPAVGQGYLYVCINDSQNVNTVGTWKPVITIN